MLLCIPSCTLHPFVRDASGSVASLGGSIFSKSDNETAYYKGPLGELGYASTKKDETVVPSKIAAYYTTKAVTEGLVDVHKTTENTKQVLSGHEVSKNATNRAAASTDLKTLNPVEVPVP